MHAQREIPSSLPPTAQLTIARSLAALPALYATHPHPAAAAVAAGAGRRLRAFAFKDELVWQLSR